MSQHAERNEEKVSGANHTPTPWKVENESIDKEGRQGYRIGNPKLGIVFDMVYSGHFAADNPGAHAAFIVRAVNSHKVLIKGLLELRDRLTMGQDSAGNSEINQDEINLINGLLAQAESTNVEGGK